MAAAAARNALELAGVDPRELDLIIVATVTGDTQTPACAAFLQAKIGAENAFAFDVSAACAGSLYALSIADQFIKTGKVRRALVVGAETLSRVVDWTNRETCVLFGDAAGAMVLGPGEEEGRGLLSTRPAHRRDHDRHSRHCGAPMIRARTGRRPARRIRSRCAAARSIRSRCACCRRS